MAVGRSVGAAQFGNYFRQLARPFAVDVGYGGAEGGQQSAVVGQDNVAVGERQVVLECLAQRGQERQRAAAHQHGRLDAAAVGQRYDGLHGHGVQY